MIRAIHAAIASSAPCQPEPARPTIRDQAYWVPLSSFPLVYAYAKDLDFTPYTDELPRFWEAKWE